MSSEQQSSGSAFPSVSTVIVGIWLFAFSIVSGIALYMSFGSGFIVKYADLGSYLSGPLLRESMIAVYSAGIGSAITTILGYLDHASIKKDFDLAYVPWYFARPLMGMLLGLIFYFVLRGGLVVIQVGGNENGPQAFSVWSTAAISALVGLFSKNAVEKLRELFNTLFHTKDDVYADLLDRLPDDLKKQLQPYVVKKGEKD